MTVRHLPHAQGRVAAADRSLVTRRADAVALVVSGAGVEAEAEADVGAEAEVGVGAEAAAGPGAGRAGGGSRATAGGGGSFTAQVFADPFFGRVVTGVVDYLRPRGVHPVLMFAETSRARDEVVAYLRQGSADGALVVSTHAEDPLPGLLTEAGLAAVLFARPARPAPISYVDLAHQDGARLAAEHLLARGAAGSPRSAARWTCRRAGRGWPASGTRWRATGTRTPRSPKGGSPRRAGRWRWNGCWWNTRIWTGCSPPTT